VTSVAFHADQLFFRVPGGIGTYVRELLPALRAADPSLELLAFHAAFDAPEDLGERTVRLRSGIRRLYPSWNALGRPRLPTELAGLDVLHAPSPAAIPPPGPGQRLVVTVHDVAFRLFPSMYPPAWRTLFRMGLRRAASRADAVIAVSEHTARDVTRVAGIERERIHVVPLAASTPGPAADPGPVLERLGIPEPYVLFVGTLEPRKNLIRLIRAYRRIAGRHPHALVLAGPSGWRGSALRRELAAAGPGRVVATSRVDAAELEALYRGATAFAYPSLYEGFGLPVLEAMIRGVPAVVARSSSLPEVAGSAALLIDPRSVEDIAAGLERLITDEQERQRLTAAGPVRAAAFSWERSARMTLDVYRSVLER
jgi:glycosyltransferase involved in cell wall biosynthesis